MESLEGKYVVTTTAWYVCSCHWRYTSPYVNMHAVMRKQILER